jgi:hypothetical protein
MGNINEEDRVYKMLRPQTLPEATLSCLRALAPHEAREVLAAYWESMSQSASLAAVHHFLEAPSKEKGLDPLPLSSLYRAASPGASEVLLCFPEDLQCSVCFGSLLDSDHKTMPQACAWGHLLCYGCAGRIPIQVRHGRDTQQCPTCFENKSLFQPFHYLQKLAGATPCVCPNLCMEILTYSTREWHLEHLCPFRWVVCL